MKLELLPFRTGGAAENMALDFLLLQHGAETPNPRFRHYGWRSPAFTFGYSQKIVLVRAALPANERIDLCRRPTGGGIVDHRDDWTYTLVIPRGHALEEVRASQSYRAVHEALVNALQAQGVPAELKPVVENPAGPKKPALEGSVCFENAEFYDAVNTRTGEKIAGAAQKRNKRGMLFQGSIWRPAAGGAAVDWEKFEEDFAAGLAKALGAEAMPAPWPEIDEDEISGLTEQYSATEWTEAR